MGKNGCVRLCLRGERLLKHAEIDSGSSRSRSGCFYRRCRIHTQGRNAEHLTGTFTIGRCDERRVHMRKPCGGGGGMADDTCEKRHVMNGKKEMCQ